MAEVQILRLVVASPGDVQAERNALPAVVEELNHGIAGDRGWRLELARWETDASPGFHPEGPQGRIDALLRIEDCDVLIGIFWKRFGTPVKDARSGTDHEFRRAYEVWQQHRRPHLMVYFNQRAYAPRTKEETDQWGQVLEFKRQFPKEGLWWSYSGRAEFERLVRRHLTPFVRQHTSTPAQRAMPPVPAPPTQLKDAPARTHQPFEPGMILIPAGKFLMGSDPQKDQYAWDDEQPPHTLYLPDYYLAETPITNAQYAFFVQATGHRSPEHWTEGRPPSNKTDHPVVCVSWEDALAYCRWLSEVTGKAYCLPSEAEWEKGARGTDGRIYPWGNRWEARRCNSDEGRHHGTTPVGAYPEGVSPYGVLNMAGNVWEWTRSLWGKHWDNPDFKYPYNREDGRENLGAPGDIFRVLRGGAFLDDCGGMRCACRGRRYPGFWYGGLGFRVVVRPFS
jgi:formylglycine-generating enzyme required for sulfatase activity